MARTPKIVEDRREQILEAAMRVFAQKGFVRATNKDIAHEAGITSGLIYHYFENKEALLRAIIETRSPLQVIRSIPPQMLALPPDAFLRHLMQQMLSILESERFVQAIRVFLPEVIHNPEMSPMGITFLHEAIEFLSSYLAGRMARGELRQADASLVAQTLAASVMGFVLRRQILRDTQVLQYSHEQIVEAVITTSLQGLLPR
jgi:AcrR family transcriptional regulator